MSSRPNNKLDKYHWHEALDRSSLALEWFAEFVEEHPVVRRTGALRKMAGELTDRICEFYQAVANADPNFKTGRGRTKKKRRGR